MYKECDNKKFEENDDDKIEANGKEDGEYEVSRRVLKDKNG